LPPEQLGVVLGAGTAVRLLTVIHCACFRNRRSRVS
jgi:hypothetical protein